MSYFNPTINFNILQYTSSSASQGAITQEVTTASKQDSLYIDRNLKDQSILCMPFSNDTAIANYL